MMTVNSLRLLFILICSTAGYFTVEANRYQGVLGGFSLAMVIFALEFIIRKVAVRDLLAGLGGLAFGLFVAVLVFTPLAYFMESGSAKTLVVTAVFLMCPYLGIILSIKKKDELFLWRSKLGSPVPDSPTAAKVLDTSVIVDGRIADIGQTGFLDGTLLIPRFVLAELQQIADSSEALKRARGRRGLEVLQAMQKAEVPIRITDQDYPQVEGVDAKLVEMAKELKCKILTTDFNLNKVAELQGVEVLNINDLANALKVVVIPGEEMDIKVIREGKEKDQGLAYLDDGTMVVVENGKSLINQRVHVAITSVLQTSAGRMIFAKRKA